jgi:hypothetical protein
MGPNDWADLMFSEKVIYITLAVCGLTAIVCGGIIVIGEVLSVSYRRYLKKKRQGGL